MRFYFAIGQTGRERELAIRLPGNPEFFNHDGSCPGFGGQS